MPAFPSTWISLCLEVVPSDGVSENGHSCEKLEGGGRVQDSIKDVELLPQAEPYLVFSTPGLPNTSKLD